MDMVSDSAAAAKDPDNLSLVVGNRELVQGSGSAAKNDDDIARADVDDVAPFKTKSRVYDYFSAVLGQPVAIDMFRARNGGRDADCEGAVAFGCARDHIGQPGRCPGKTNASARRDCATQALGKNCETRSLLGRQSVVRRAHHPYFDRWHSRLQSSGLYRQLCLPRQDLSIRSLDTVEGTLLMARRLSRPGQTVIRATAGALLAEFLVAFLSLFHEIKEIRRLVARRVETVEEPRAELVAR